MFILVWLGIKPGSSTKKTTWSSMYANHYTMPHPQKLFCYNSDHSDLSGCSPYFSKPWMIIHSKLGIGFITVINQMSQSCIVLFQFPEIKKILTIERRKISRRRQINLQEKRYSVYFVVKTAVEAATEKLKKTMSNYAPTERHRKAKRKPKEKNP